MEVFVTNRRKLMIGRERNNMAAFLYSVFYEALSLGLQNGRLGTSLHVKQFYRVGRPSRLAGLRGFARRGGEGTLFCGGGRRRSECGFLFRKCNIVIHIVMSIGIVLVH